jgi:hypothetical protein
MATDMLPDVTELEEFRSQVQEVAEKRDLATATEYGARLNRIISRFDRGAGQVPASQQLLLELAHSRVRLMMNCPRRMRLDNTWQDDFVIQAVKAVDALMTLARLIEQQAVSDTSPP